MLLGVFSLFLLDQPDHFLVAGFLALDFMLIEVSTGSAVALIFSVVLRVFGIHVLVQAMSARSRGVGARMMLSVVVKLVILFPLLLFLRFLKGLLPSVGVARAFVFAILHS